MSDSGIKQLWAPWRLDYVKSDKKKDGCIFCNLLEDKASEKNLILTDEDPDVFVTLNKFPYNPYHILLLPKCHCPSPSELEARVWAKIGVALQICHEILEKETHCQGCNMGLNVGSAGGAGIPEHLHWHILPRWNGDTNFMPLIAEVKALPTHNLNIYERLKPVFKDFAEKLNQARMGDS